MTSLAENDLNQCRPSISIQWQRTQIGGTKGWSPSRGNPSPHFHLAQSSEHK
jgi:hypothetical protein